MRRSIRTRLAVRLLIEGLLPLAPGQVAAGDGTRSLEKIVQKQRPPANGALRRERDDLLAIWAEPGGPAFHRENNWYRVLEISQAPQPNYVINANGNNVSLPWIRIEGKSGH